MEDLTNVAEAPAAAARFLNDLPSVANITIDTTSHRTFAPSVENKKVKYPIEVTVNLNGSNNLHFNLLTVFLTFAWDPDISPNPAPRVVTLMKVIQGKNTKQVKLFDEVELKDLKPGTDYHMEMGTVAFLANNPLETSTNYVRIKWRTEN